MTMVDLNTSRSMLEETYLAALGGQRGEARKRMARAFEPAFLALAAIDTLPPGTDARFEGLDRAENCLREVATWLRRSHRPWGHVQAARLDEAANEVHAFRQQSLEALGRSSPSSTPEVATEEAAQPETFRLSHGAPRRRRVAMGHGPPGRTQSAPSATRTLPDPRSAVPKLQGELTGWIQRVSRRGPTVLDELESLVPATSVTAAKLVVLQRPKATEDTKGERGERCMLRRIARSAMEELATAGQLRALRDHDRVEPQMRRHDARAIAALDALIALSVDGPVTLDLIDTVLGWADDGFVAEPFRPFVRALVLGTCETPTSAAAAVAALRASAPSTYASQVHALLLAPDPRLDEALQEALGGASEPQLVPLLDALAARRGGHLSVLRWYLLHESPEVRAQAAIAVQRQGDRSGAAEALESLLQHEHDPEVCAVALRSLALLALPAARPQLRLRLDEERRAPGQMSRRARRHMLQTLSIVGARDDAEAVLLPHLSLGPRDADVLGWHGHPLLLGPMLECVDADDVRIAGSATRGLHRLTRAPVYAPRPGTASRDEYTHAAPWSREQWEGWLSEHLDAGIPRLRDGRAYAPTLTADEATTLDGWARDRRLALYELEAATGRPLPDARDWLATIEGEVDQRRPNLAAISTGHWLTAPAE